VMVMTPKYWQTESPPIQCQVVGQLLTNVNRYVSRSLTGLPTQWSEKRIGGNKFRIYFLGFFQFFECNYFMNELISQFGFFFSV
jgi:hypothetical protein